MVPSQARLLKLSWLAIEASHTTFLPDWSPDLGNERGHNSLGGVRVTISLLRGCRDFLEPGVAFPPPGAARDGSAASKSRVAKPTDRGDWGTSRRRGRAHSGELLVLHACQPPFVSLLRVDGAFVTASDALPPSELPNKFVAVDDQHAQAWR